MKPWCARRDRPVSPCAMLRWKPREFARPVLRSNPPQMLKGAFEVRDQIIWIFQPDMEAGSRPGQGRWGRGAANRAGRRQCEAFEAAPRSANTEEFQRVDHFDHGVFGNIG